MRLAFGNSRETAFSCGLASCRTPEQDCHWEQSWNSFFPLWSSILQNSSIVADSPETVYKSFPWSSDLQNNTVIRKIRNCREKFRIQIYTDWQAVWCAFFCLFFWSKEKRCSILGGGGGVSVMPGLAYLFGLVLVVMQTQIYSANKLTFGKHSIIHYVNRKSDTKQTALIKKGHYSLFSLFLWAILWCLRKERKKL